MRKFVLFFVATFIVLSIGCQNSINNTIENKHLPDIISVDAPGSKVIQVTFNSYDEEIYEFYKYISLDNKILSSEIEDGIRVEKEKNDNNIICEDRQIRQLPSGNVVLNIILKDNIEVGYHYLSTNEEYFSFPIQKDETPPTILSVKLIAKSVAQYTFSEDVIVPSAYVFYKTTNNINTTAHSSLSFTDNIYEVYWAKEINNNLNIFCAGTEEYDIEDFSGNKLDQSSFKSVLPDANLPYIVSR